MTIDERLLRQRFGRLAGVGEGDWSDVRRRARGRRLRTTTIVVAALALVGAGIGLGGDVIGAFNPHGKRISLDSLLPDDRRLVEFAMCKRLDFEQAASGAPRAVCLDGEPTIEEIANDGYEFRWSVRYPSGAVCTATGRVGRYQVDPPYAIGMYDCGAEQQYPTPQRPITADVAISISNDHPDPRLFEVSGLAGSGIESVGLVADDGSVLRKPVRGRAYSFREIPDRPWIALAAYGPDGHEVYREPLRYGREMPTSPAPAPPPSEPAPPRRPAGAPAQHASTSAASVDAYEKGVVAVRLGAEAFHRLTDLSNGVSPVTVGCSRLAFGAGRWDEIGGFGSAPAGRELIVRVARPFLQGEPLAPPFDYCETSGIAEAQHWQEAGQPRELVEVAFTPLGRRYLDERAAARDASLFVRTPEILRIRGAVARGETAPSATAIARLFGSRVLALGSRDEKIGPGRIGVSVNGEAIVVSEITPKGRRLYIKVRGRSVAATNVRGLAEPH
jgi:hypothetical protein